LRNQHGTGAKFDAREVPPIAVVVGEANIKMMGVKSIYLTIVQFKPTTPGIVLHCMMTCVYIFVVLANEKGLIYRLQCVSENCGYLSYLYVFIG
jgi:hypothetical protein